MNVALHVSLGVCGLLVGLVPLLSIKGAAVHRRFGLIFVGLASMVLLTALIADVAYRQPIALLAASLSAGYQYIASLRALALRTHGPNTIDALLAMAALAGCAALIASMNAGTASWSPMIGYSTAGYLASIALYDLSRPLWAKVWLQRIRPLDHGLKMAGCYFAMFSAGMGNLFKNLQPWSQVLPSSLGLLVMLVLAIMYWHRLRASRARLVDAATR
ncbi:hypothetical protein [Dyella tabacisoli]|uniref:hypothetical protein n=1 Tax=Dyella tabacisoli TaxID=2282381 RepID=UPI0017871253|nr:hypothetical protein [Dyella tabacisoli]